ncbi:MAG: preprotein translocase subunit YajC [Propioniciclava sp.]
METIIMLVLMVAVFYFLLIRPQQKKQREHRTMMNDLGAGARIMTNAGIFGTIAHMGDKQAIIEVAPGVEMTVMKQAIMRVVDPAEDEFEYDDEAREDDVSAENAESTTAVEPEGPVAAADAVDGTTDSDTKN